MNCCMPISPLLHKPRERAFTKFDLLVIITHMDGQLSAGGNLAMLDGHVEWRKFQLMTIQGGGGPSAALWVVNQRATATQGVTTTR